MSTFNLLIEKVGNGAFSAAAPELGIEQVTAIDSIIETKTYDYLFH